MFKEKHFLLKNIFFCFLIIFLWVYFPILSSFDFVSKSLPERFEKDLVYWTIAIVKLLVRAFSNHPLVDKIEFMNNI